MMNSSADAEGSLEQMAIADQTINALVVAGSVAAAGGGVAGIAGSGSGVRAENKVAAQVKAFIDGDGSTGIIADSISLTADDTSSIKSIAASASLAAAVGGVVGGSLSIAITLAQNDISNEVMAYIEDADTKVEARMLTWQCTSTLRFPRPRRTAAKTSKSGAVGSSKRIGRLTNTSPWRPTIRASSRTASGAVGGTR